MRTLVLVLMVMALAGPVVAQEQAQPQVILDARSYSSPGVDSQLIHTGVIWQNDQMSNLYLIRDQQGLALGQADHLFPLGNGLRLGPAIIIKRDTRYLGAVVDYSQSLAGGQFYGWLQMRPRLTGTGPTQVVIDPLQQAWSLDDHLSAGVRATIVLTDGAKPNIGVGPTISYKTGNSIFDIHFYPQTKEVRLQFVHKL